MSIVYRVTFTGKRTGETFRKDVATLAEVDAIRARARAIVSVEERHETATATIFGIGPFRITAEEAQDLARIGRTLRSLS